MTGSPATDIFGIMQYTANSINGSNLEPKKFGNPFYEGSIPADAQCLISDGRITNAAAAAYAQSGNCRGVRDCGETVYLEGVCPQCGNNSYGIEISTGRGGCVGCGGKKKENWTEHGCAVTDEYSSGVRAPGGDSLPSRAELRLKVPKYLQRTKDGKERGMMAPSVAYGGRNAYEVAFDVVRWATEVQFPDIPGKRRNATRERSMRRILLFLGHVSGKDPAKPRCHLHCFYSATRIGQNVGLSRKKVEKHLMQLAEWGMIVIDTRFYVEGRGRDIWINLYWDRTPDQIQAMPEDDPYRLDKSQLFPVPA